MRESFGKEARYLIVEALVDRGVVVSPLVKYIDFNIRASVPYGLTREQIETVMEHVLSRVGLRMTGGTSPTSSATFFRCI